MALKIGELIQDLLVNTALSNQEIVNKVKEQFPDANTTTKSVASIASVARKYGVKIEKRKFDPSEKVRELELLLELANDEIERLKAQLEEEIERKVA